MRHYKRARRNGWVLPVDRRPEVGSPSGFGAYGVLERDEESVLCHECGARLGALGYHLRRVHEMSADEYREAHGLARAQPLVSLAVSERQSARASERVGSPGWQRLEARRDPVAASAARDPESLTRPRAAVQADKPATSRANLPRRSRQVRICPACGVPYTARGRTCGDPACVAALIAESGRRLMESRYRRLVTGEVEALRAAAGDMGRLGPLVRRLQADRVSSSEIGRAIGRRPPWMTRHFPLP